MSADGSDEAVEDFQDVDPRYGTLAEFNASLASLKSAGKCFFNVQCQPTIGPATFTAWESGPRYFFTPALIQVCFAENLTFLQL